MTISLDQIIYYLCILVRISGFIFTAPFFNLNNVPRRVKVGLSCVLALVLFEVLPYQPLVYQSVVDFTAIILKEMIAGLLLGFFANICMQILAFAGSIMDMEMGFSMVQEFDPSMKSQVTVTANLYKYAVLLMMLTMDLHYYILRAIIDSFTIVPIGRVVINPSIYKVFIQFIIDYFIIGFRIVLPMFAAILIVNTVLAILAKVAPQMNMFVIGLQLKVLVGLIVLIFISMMIPTVADFIFTKMMDMMESAIVYLKG